MSQQGLCVLTNPFINCESSFRGPFWQDNDLVFRDCWWVKRGCVGRRIHSSPVKGVSGAFFTRLRVSFPWLLISQQGLWGLTNPFIKCENSFEGYFWVGSNSVFLEYLWVTRGCLGCQIHSPPVKAVSGAISEWAASQFSLTVYESTGAVWEDESIRHLWKEFRGPFFTRQRVSFPWLLISQQGLWGLTNPFVTCENSFEGYFWVGSNSVFLDCLWVPRAVWADESIRHLCKEFRGLLLTGHRVSFLWLFLSQQRLWGLTNPFVTCEKTFKGNFWVGSD